MVNARRALLTCAALVWTLGCEAEIGSLPKDIEGDAATEDASLDGATDGPGAEVGACAPCSVWEVRCGDRCVDLTVSPENCGACGVRCDGRAQVCRSGVCAGVTARCASVIPASDGGAEDGGAVDAGASVQGLRAEYYATASLTGLRRVRIDPTVNFDWTMAEPPGVAREAFSARWVGTVRSLYSETYTFVTATDDGARLWVDDQLLIDDWTTHGVQEARGTVELVAYRPYSIRLEYFNGAGAGSTRLFWSSASQMRELVPARALTPVSGVDYGCEGGVCCAAGGATPVCCPATTRCVNNARYAGCCPLGEACGEVPVCTRPAR